MTSGDGPAATTIAASGSARLNAIMLVLGVSAGAIYLPFDKQHWWRWARHIPTPVPAVAGYVTVIALVSTWLLHRGFRQRVCFDGGGVTVCRLLRAERYSWPEVSRFADGFRSSEGGQWWVLLIMLSSGRTVTVSLPLSRKPRGNANPETLAEIRQVAARYQIPADLTGTPRHPDGTGQRGLSSRRKRLVFAVAAFVVLVGVGVPPVIKMIARSSAPAPPPPPPPRPTPSLLEATADQLEPGDCLAGPGLGLGTNSPWPALVTVVSCIKWHIAEVFFTSNAWPQSQPYPGDSKLISQAEDRCNAAFITYDGIASDNSIFTYDFIYPSDADDWASGDRWLACVAYDSTTQYPGGTPVDYSIKGTGQ